MQYKVCPNCGAHLDSGERCDCQDEKETPKEPKNDEEASTNEEERNFPRCRNCGS